MIAGTLIPEYLLCQIYIYKKKKKKKKIADSCYPVNVISSKFIY